MCINSNKLLLIINIHRSVEGELFPCLRQFGIRFYAYNPVSEKSCDSHTIIMIVM